MFVLSSMIFWSVRLTGSGSFCSPLSTSISSNMSSSSSSSPIFLEEMICTNTSFVALGKLHISFNSLPYDKTLTWSNLKEFADNKIEVYQKTKFVLNWLENILGNGENAGYQHFLLFPKCF